MFVPFFMCSQEEQYFINGKLPDFHQVDIPDMWIGLSGPLWFGAHENVKKDIAILYTINEKAV